MKMCGKVRVKLPRNNLCPTRGAWSASRSVCLIPRAHLIQSPELVNWLADLQSDLLLTSELFD